MPAKRRPRMPRPCRTRLPNSAARRGVCVTVAVSTWKGARRAMATASLVDPVMIPTAVVVVVLVVSVAGVTIVSPVVMVMLMVGVAGAATHHPQNRQPTAGEEPDQQHRGHGQEGD
jgi:hypothetical protein